MKPRTIPADMPLTKLVKQYVKDRASEPDRNGKPLTVCYVQQLERFVKLFRWFLHRQPVAADLRPEVLPDC